MFAMYGVSVNLLGSRSTKGVTAYDFAGGGRRFPIARYVFVVLAVLPSQGKVIDVYLQHFSVYSYNGMGDKLLTA